MWDNRFMRFSMTSKATSNSFSRFAWTTPLEPVEGWRIKAKQARPKLRNKSSVRCNKILILGCWVNVVRQMGGQEFAIVPLTPYSLPTGAKARQAFIPQHANPEERKTSLQIGPSEPEGVGDDGHRA